MDGFRVMLSFPPSTPILHLKMTLKSHFRLFPKSVHDGPLMVRSAHRWVSGDREFFTFHFELGLKKDPKISFFFGIFHKVPMMVHEWADLPSTPTNAYQNIPSPSWDRHEASLKFLARYDHPCGR